MNQLEDFVRARKLYAYGDVRAYGFISTVTVLLSVIMLTTLLYFR